MVSSRPDLATSNFAFLKEEWPDIYDAAARAERLALSDARAACFYESPFIDISPRGPEGVFSTTRVDELASLLSEVRRRATG